MPEISSSIIFFIAPMLSGLQQLSPGRHANGQFGLQVKWENTTQLLSSQLKEGDELNREGEQYYSPIPCHSTSGMVPLGALNWTGPPAASITGPARRKSRAVDVIPAASNAEIINV